MSEHKAVIDWSRDGKEFTYAGYSRNHTMTFENGATLGASAAVAFRGDAEKVDPEALYVASLSSCHMLTFLSIAARQKLVVESYRDEAVGVLEKNEQGKLAVTKVTLHPQIVFGGEGVDEATLAAMHERSHAECFIANSVKTVVGVGG